MPCGCRLYLQRRDFARRCAAARSGPDRRLCVRPREAGDLRRLKAAACICRTVWRSIVGFALADSGGLGPGDPFHLPAHDAGWSQTRRRCPVCQEGFAGGGRRINELLSGSQRCAFRRLPHHVLQVPAEQASRSTRMTTSSPSARMKSRSVHSSSRFWGIYGHAPSAYWIRIFPSQRGPEGQRLCCRPCREVFEAVPEVAGRGLGPAFRQLGSGAVTASDGWRGRGRSADPLGYVDPPSINDALTLELARSICA